MMILTVLHPPLHHLHSHYSHFHFNAENTFFFMSAAPSESQIGSIREVWTQSQTVTCSIPAKPDIQFTFSGYPWIPKLLYKILNIVMYILIIIESNVYLINANCNKCYQFESNTQLFGFEFGLLQQTQFGFQVVQHSRKKYCFPHWNENSCKFILNLDPESDTWRKKNWKKYIKIKVCGEGLSPRYQFVKRRFHDSSCSHALIAVAVIYTTFGGWYCEPSSMHCVCISLYVLAYHPWH